MPIRFGSLQGQQYHAHRLVLAAHSPFFRKMLASDMVEANRRRVSIEVDHMQAEMLLRYMYG